MNKVLKVFLALILAVMMTIEIVPAKVINADDDVTETTEPADVTPEDENKTEAGTDDTEPEDTTEPPVSEEETTEILLNETPYSETFELGSLIVKISYPEATLPKDTEVKVSEAGEEAIKAIRESYGENVAVRAADISFIYEGEEIEPVDYSENKVTVSLSYQGSEDLSKHDFTTVHVTESLNEEGVTVYGVDKVDATITDIVDKVQVPVYETREITKTEKVPYTYTWTETVQKYKDVDVYENVEVPYEVEKEVPVYETRDITEEQTQLVTKTREVEKYRWVWVKVQFVWYNPATWLGYKLVHEKYYETEEYQEEETVTVVVGQEEVQVGTKTVTEIEYRTESRYVRTDTEEDGTEEITHTETRYKDVEVGTGEYETVLTGYREEEAVVGKTSVFEADEFSVYAFVELEVPYLLTVEFYNGSTQLSQVYVKALDTEEDLKTIVYDPGAGTLGDGEVFMGWVIEDVKDTYTTETNLMTIDQVRTAVKATAAALTADTTVKYYAGIFKSFNITYQSDDENPVMVGATSIRYPAYETNPEIKYTVNMGYTVDGSHNFEGWMASDTSSQSHIKNYPAGATEETVVSGGNTTTYYYYPNETEITITGDVTFTVRAPEGRWLVFDENGKGATYTAPQFVLSGYTTQEPSTINSMVRNGYTFGGWYDTKEHADAHAADTTVTTGAFTFGGTLTANTTIYASWIPKTSASYTILIWKQNVDANGYDFEASRILDGTVGENVSSVVKEGTGDSAYATINGTSYQYTGFHLKSFDSEVEIVPEGTSVVNVYYDRNIYTLTFEASGSGYRYTRDDDNGTWGYVNDTWVELTGTVVETITTTTYHLSQNENHSNNDAYAGTVYSDQNGTVANSPIYPNTYYRRRNYGSGYRVLYWHEITNTETVMAYTYTDDQGEHSYTGPRFTRQDVNNGWITVKTISATFGKSIADEFPISGSNGIEYPTGTRWQPQSTLVVDGVTYFTQNVVVAYVDSMTPGSMTFHYNPNPTTNGYAERTMNYWVEALAGTEDDPSDPNTTTYKNKVYVKHQTVKAVYYGVTIEDYIDFVGFEHFEADKYLRNTYYRDSDSNNGTRSTTVNFYYTRLKYRINYMDGVYLDGNGNTIQHHESNPLTTSEEIYYGESLADYNIEPSLPAGELGYVFEGWCMDEAGVREFDFDSTMPVGGLTLHAKWRQIQYRVFLHTGLTADDGTNLYWGSDTQALSFRVAYGGKASLPTGTRDGYKFLGWYTSSGSSFSSSTALNETTVSTDYVKSETPTDPETRPWYGPWDVTTSGASNSDLTGWDDDNNPETPGLERYWITKKLDLYAKWSKILNGADGINVEYTAEGYDENDSTVALSGSNAPTDNAIYIDASDVVTGAASTAPEGYVFSHWVVASWNGSAYTYNDESERVLPGETFSISADDAKIEDLGNDKKKYTVQLIALYVKEEEPVPTHIYWYSNLQDVVGNDLELNEFDTDVDTTDQGMYVVKVETVEVGGESHALAINEPINIPVAETYAYPGYTFLGWAKKADATEDELFLKYVPAATRSEEAHYEAKAADGTWKEVTQVAADENKPYDDLYAIWAGEFKVYHSGVEGGNVETISLLAGNMTKDGNAYTFDLTTAKSNMRTLSAESKDTYSGLTSNTLYGGYYLADAFTADAVDAADETKGYKQYAINADGTATWTWDGANAQTTPATKMQPKAGETYYIKEVPTTYLQPYTHYSFYLSTGNIGDIFLVSAIDDGNYEDTGFIISYADSRKAKVVKSLKVTNTSGGKTVTLTVKDQFDLDKGYLTYYKNAGNTVTDGCKVVQYWETPDKLFVTGTTIRELKDIANKDTIKGNDTEINSVIKESISAINSAAAGN